MRFTQAVAIVLSIGWLAACSSTGDKKSGDAAVVEDRSGDAGMDAHRMKSTTPVASNILRLLAGYAIEAGELVDFLDCEGAVRVALVDSG